MPAQYLWVADPVKNTSLVMPERCIVCKRDPEPIEVDGPSFYRFSVQGQLIQVAFPHMPPEEREMLVSGIHPVCWDVLSEEEGE